MKEKSLNEKPEIISMTHPLKSPFYAEVKMTGQTLSIKKFSVKINEKAKK